MNRKEKALKLRLEGKSYGEILKALKISSKGTLSYWFRNLKLPLSTRKKLKTKIALAHKRGLIAFNKRRTQAIVAENKRIFTHSTREIPKLSRKDFLLVGTALYWGEGTTREKSRGYQTVSFSNSDPAIIKIFMRYLREILKVPDKRIRAGIQIHKNIKPEKAKKFWARVTSLPEDRFYITHQISKSSKLKRPKNFLPYGTLAIKIYSRQLFYKIKGYIQGIAEQ